MRIVIALAAAAVFSVPFGSVHAAIDCEPARCAVQEAINERCRCDAATNHGRHVSCVAHVVKELSKSKNGEVPLIPTNCKGKVKRCAARSTCGKPGFVTCTFTELGTCDLGTSTCVEPAGTPCASNADCVIDSRCRTKSSEEKCTAAGGVSGTGTCCADCPEPTPVPTP